MEKDDDFTDWLIAREECIMDLDDEELKATRKLNGVAKESNIEEDINLIKLKEISERFSNGTETIEDIINYCRNYKIKFENGLKLRVVEKRYFDKLVERIKELEEENKIYILNGDNVKLELYIKENYIPVQKVKDKIEELKKDYEDSKDENGETEYYYPDYTIRKLEELLEDK